MDIVNAQNIDSPALLLIKENLLHNLDLMIRMVDGDTNRLIPHIKTNKSSKVIAEMLKKGLTKFKAATISEAELAAKVGAKEVLLAHQPVGPKIERCIALQKTYPELKFAVIVDNVVSAFDLNEAFGRQGLTLKVFIDVNVGMNRTGIELAQLNSLIENISTLDKLELAGLHIYDGHLRDTDAEARAQKVVNWQIELITNSKYAADLAWIVGGSPTFPIHAKNKDHVCSPGTTVFWDEGYGHSFSDVAFKEAIVILSRVISKPKEGIVTIDLGHKSVAAENPIDKRIKFLNITDATLVSQSEEHGVLEVKNWNDFQIGQIIYGIPFHVCPTVNLHQSLYVMESDKIVDEWAVEARDRKLSI